MKDDEQIKGRIRRSKWEARYVPDGQSVRGIESKIQKLETELRDPAALLPDVDLREVCDQRED